jgi:hypothetical protein
MVKEASSMPATFGAGSLLSPWVGVWDLVWQSPEAWLAVASTAIGLALAGTVLTFMGKGQRANAATPAMAVVRSQRESRPVRRSRRRRRAA